MKRLIVLLLFVLPLVAVGQGSRTPDIKFLSYCDEGVDFYRVVWNRTATDIRILNNVGMDFEEFIPSGNELPGECSSSLCIDSASYSDDTLRIYCGGDAYLTEIVSGGGGGPTLYTADGAVNNRTVDVNGAIKFELAELFDGTELILDTAKSVGPFPPANFAGFRATSGQKFIFNAIFDLFGSRQISAAVIDTVDGSSAGLSVDIDMKTANLYYFLQSQTEHRVLVNANSIDMLSSHSGDSSQIIITPNSIAFDVLSLAGAAVGDVWTLESPSSGSGSWAQAGGGTWPPAPYTDDAAAGAAGLLTGRWYQTSGAGAAPLNVAGILMVKQ